MPLLDANSCHCCQSAVLIDKLTQVKLFLEEEIRFLEVSVDISFDVRPPPTLPPSPGDLLAPWAAALLLRAPLHPHPQELMVSVGRVFVESYLIRFEDEDKHHVTLKARSAAAHSRLASSSVWAYTCRRRTGLGGPAHRSAAIPEGWPRLPQTFPGKSCGEEALSVRRCWWQKGGLRERQGRLAYGAARWVRCNESGGSCQPVDAARHLCSISRAVNL